MLAWRASDLLLSEQGRNLRHMLDWTHCSVVERVPGKVSGAWVFKGTRVPVQALFENLEGGATVDQFLAWFPGVTREQAPNVLKFDESPSVFFVEGHLRSGVAEGTRSPFSGR